MPARRDLRSILLIGSGPIVIGQGCEFDYSGTQAAKVLRVAPGTIRRMETAEVGLKIPYVQLLLKAYGIADDDARVNPYGGAIAMGHPLASSGVRLMTQLATAFEERPEARYGLTTMCVGIGMGGTVIWENPQWEGK